MNIMRVLLVSVLLAFPAAHAQEAPLAAMPAGAASAPPPAAAPALPAADRPASAPAAQSAVAPGAPAVAAPPATTPRKRPHPKHGAPKQNAPAPRHKVAPDMQAGRNPVIEAINLVATTQRDEIRAADSKVADADWWLDTLERDWIVRRPFGPGLFDSTHWFYVSYRVNGRIIMSWFVDLEKRTVAPIAPPERQSAR